MGSEADSWHMITNYEASRTQDGEQRRGPEPEGGDGGSQGQPHSLPPAPLQAHTRPRGPEVPAPLARGAAPSRRRGPSPARRGPQGCREAEEGGQPALLRGHWSGLTAQPPTSLRGRGDQAGLPLSPPPLLCRMAPAPPASACLHFPNEKQLCLWKGAILVPRFLSTPLTRRNGCCSLEELRAARGRRLGAPAGGAGHGALSSRDSARQRKMRGPTLFSGDPRSPALPPVR